MKAQRQVKITAQPARQMVFAAVRCPGFVGDRS